MYRDKRAHAQGGGVSVQRIQSEHKTMGACRGNTCLIRTIPRDAERYALIALGCMMRWTDATSANMYKYGITECFRSVRTFRCRAASANTGHRGQRGGVAGALAECPTTVHPLRIGDSESKSSTGTTVDKIIKIGRGKRRTHRISTSDRPLVHGSKRQRGNGTTSTQPRASCHCLQLLSQFSPRTRQRTRKAIRGTYSTTKQVWVRQHSAR